MERRAWGRAAGGLGLVVAACAAGCNPGSMAYFFLPENKVDPEVHRLASEDPKKEPRVVILTYTGVASLPAELIQADQQLSFLLAKALREACEANKERLTIVNPAKVEEFKNSHPAWYQSDLRDVGRYFRADHVVYLEINHLTLFDKVNLNMLYKGHADLTVSVVDVNHPDETPERKELSVTYPSEAKAIAVDAETTPAQFRQVFLKHVAKKLSWCFTAHLPREDYSME
jgi:hypothetical protein